jgi:fatty acid desaturase
MPYGSEKDVSKRTRVIIAAVVWLVIALPVFIWFWQMVGWWVLIGVAVAIWVTYDYIKKGGTGDVVDRFKYPV